MIALLCSLCVIAYLIYLHIASGWLSRNLPGGKTPLRGGKMLSATYKIHTAPSKEDYSFIRWMGLASGGVLSLWGYSALCSTQDNYGSFWTILLRPVLHPIGSNPSDLAIQISLWLFVFYLAGKLWLHFARSKADSYEVRALIREFNKNGASKTVPVLLNEVHPYAWSQELIGQLKRGSIITWQGEKIAAQEMPYDKLPASYGFQSDADRTLEGD